MTAHAVVSAKGAARWAHGHPWIYRSDVIAHPETSAGAVRVRARSGGMLGWALWSPRSEISLRLLDRRADVVDGAWWQARLATAIARRAALAEETTACRLVHAEADGAPSLIVDRYDRWLVVQLLSAGIERFRSEIVDALLRLTGAAGILARHDVAVRAREGLPQDVELLAGSVPDRIEIREHGVRYLAAPWTGQKTGAFLDQRENRALVGRLARGRALDCFAYHGSFALHLARGAAHVLAVDSSAAALTRARENAALNGSTTIEFLEDDVFEVLRRADERRARYDTIVLDPPAFAKTRGAVASALRGYKEINRRAMRLLAPGGLLFTASCSFHIGRAAFLEMLEGAAADSGRDIALRELRGQASDHPEILTIPESGYIKAALLEARD